MKFLLYILLFAIVACHSSNEKELSNKKIDDVQLSFEDTTVVVYDSLLAKKFAADDYGMKPYVLAILLTGPNPPKDSIHAVELQTAHMATINRLAEEEKLVLAGPFYGNNKENYRGIYIFNTSSIDSAKAYTNTDPAIKYGSLKIELINWYGSAALMDVNRIHQKIARIDL